LEFYEKGFRKRVNLHLYLISDDAPNAKSINAKTLQQAQEIRSQNILNPPSFDKKENAENERAKTLTWLQWVDEYIQLQIVTIELY
jgi:hypothetical protein